MIVKIKEGFYLNSKYIVSIETGIFNAMHRIVIDYNSQDERGQNKKIIVDFVVGAIADELMSQLVKN